MQQAIYAELLLRNDAASMTQLRAQCAETPQPDEPQIVAYLGAPLEFQAAGIIPADRIGGGDLPSSWALRSDGTWVWSNALEHYVRRYHFRIPPDFARHMAARGWLPPRRQDVDWDRVLQLAE